jgi:hypothetical protein
VVETVNGEKDVHEEIIDSEKDGHETVGSEIYAYEELRISLGEHVGSIKEDPGIDSRMTHFENNDSLFT